VRALHCARARAALRVPAALCPRAAAPAALVLAVLAAGCGDGGGAEQQPRAQTPTATATASPSATATPRATPKPSRPTLLRAPRCRAEVPDCHNVSGRIVYVERVDPDGDGDLHVVVTDHAGVTLAGLTSIDVSKDLRPRRDPRIGERAAAMGPVQTGSYGQSQVHALVFRARR
jgi:hypothetical protein